MNFRGFSFLDYFLKVLYVSIVFLVMIIIRKDKLIINFEFFFLVKRLDR